MTDADEMPMLVDFPVEQAPDTADKLDTKTHEVFFDFFDDLPDTDGGVEHRDIKARRFSVLIFMEDNFVDDFVNKLGTDH